MKAIINYIVFLIGVLIAQFSFPQVSEVVNMGSVINSSARDAEPTFTPDGQTMYFNCFDRQGEEGSDICVSHRQGLDWTEPTIVWEVSTREHMEVEPLLSPDGQQLYIMSTRQGRDGHLG